MKDKYGKEIELQDYEAIHGVGVQIGCTGHRLWVCIDGNAVLRVKAPSIQLDDMREKLKDEREVDVHEDAMISAFGEHGQG